MQHSGPGSLQQVTLGAFIDQALPASPADNKAASLIISLIAGKLLPETIFDTVNEVSLLHCSYLFAPCILVIYMQSLFSLRLARLGKCGPRFTTWV